MHLKTKEKQWKQQLKEGNKHWHKRNFCKESLQLAKQPRANGEIAYLIYREIQSIAKLSVTHPHDVNLQT